MMKRIVCALFFAMLASLALAAEAIQAKAGLPQAKWYVSQSTGKKKNAGDAPDAPLKGIEQAIEKAAPGDVIYIAAGNYSGPMGQGWIEVNKPVILIGGFSPDFSTRDIAEFKTMMKPTNAMNETKPMDGSGTLTIRTDKDPDGVTVIDGFFFDQGDANSYHPEKGKPEGFELGMWLQPPAKGNTQFPSIDRYTLHFKSKGTLVIRNCVFLNGSNYALQGAHFEGKVQILNNVFINNRMVGCNVTSSNGKPFMVEVEFAYNTVLFTWSRNSEMTDMGYGVRANTGVVTNIHHNVIGLSVMAGFDDTLGDPKNKKVSLDNNIFFLNKTADVTVTVSPNIKKMKVTDDSFEDLEDYPGIESCEDNESLADPKVFAGILDQKYLEAFLSASYSEQTDFDPNSPVNQFRSMFGMNQQGTITTKVSMFCNKYPDADVMKLFGAIEGVGAQAVK